MENVEKLNVECESEDSFKRLSPKMQDLLRQKGVKTFLQQE